MLNIRPLCLAFFALVLSAAPLFAQPMPGVGPAQRPSFSPYLNLLNRGNNPTLNYLGIVRPQQQLNQQVGQLQNQANQQSQASNSGGASDTDFINPTGNVSVFNNTAGYFNRYGGSGGQSAFGTTNRMTSGGLGGIGRTPNGAAFNSIGRAPQSGGGGGLGGAAGGARR